MTRQKSPKRKLYVYAIAPADNGRSYGPIGLEGGTVYSMTLGRVSAVVSDVPERLRPERRQLAAHQEVLQRLMTETVGILPVAFGVVANAPEAIQGILSRNQKTMLAQLQRVAGRVEMGVRVAWDVPNIFDYFVQTHPELRAARDRFFGVHREPSQDDKIELGRMFDRLLGEDREEHTDRVVEALMPSCVEIKRNKPRNEREVMNLACLIGRAGRDEFEAAIFEAAKRFDNNYAFDYNGPWAPHNFTDLTLDL